MSTRIFKTSRLSAGNLVFPMRIEVWPDKIVRIKPHLAGADLKTIRMDQVASVQIRTGPLAGIRIESKGGDHIAGHGFASRDVTDMQEMIEQYRTSQGTDGT
jgi:hypothetical protein